jgi:hypothetical protein
MILAPGAILGWVRPALLVVGITLVVGGLMAGGVSLLIGWDLPRVAVNLWEGAHGLLAAGVAILLACWAGRELMSPR